MPPPHYKNITIPTWLFEKLQATQRELVHQGFQSIPPEAIPPECRTASNVSLATVVAIALQALENARTRPLLRVTFSKKKK
jgi:hypothetical protein